MKLILRKESHAAVFLSAGNSNKRIADDRLFSSKDTLGFTIGATDHSDNRWIWSNYGPQLDFVAPSGDIIHDEQCPSDDGDVPSWDAPGSAGLAPGCDIAPCAQVSAGNHSCSGGGTSLACPTAAAIAGLVLSRRPDFMDSADVGMALYNVLKYSCEDKGDSDYDTLYGWGRVNAARALAHVARGDACPDGKFDILDVITISSVAFRGVSCLPVQYSIGDLNCDSVICVVDVVLIVNIAFRGSPASEVISPCTRFMNGATCCPSPVLESPADGATGVQTAVNLVWTPPYWATEYFIEIDDNADFSSPLASHSVGSDTYFDTSGLSAGTTYHWRVGASGSDCSPVPCASWSFRTEGGGEAESYFANAVTIQSRDVDCSDSSVTVGVYVSNRVPLSGLVLPLEIRSAAGGAYLTGPMTVTASGRLDTFLTYQSYASYLPTKDATGISCGGYGYATRGTFDTLSTISPTAVLYVGIANADSLLLPPGDDLATVDTTPSLALTFGIAGVNGTFEIDTTCVTPANHLIFVDGRDVWNTLGITPSFTKGVITVGRASLAGHVTGHDTVSCNVTMGGDVTIDSGASLTVRPGSELLAIAHDDSLGSGVDLDRVEIIVYGDLILGDSTSGNILIGSDSAAADAWYGIRVMPGGRISTHSPATIQNALYGITIDSLAAADTLSGLTIRNCDIAGIATWSDNVHFISDTISDVASGSGISVQYANPRIEHVDIIDCQYGIYAVASKSRIRDSRVRGTGQYGIYHIQDAEFPGDLDTLYLRSDSIGGYFTGAHLFAGYKAHMDADSCWVVANYVEGSQSDYGVKASQDAFVKIRHTLVKDFGTAGVYSYKSKTDLGRYASSNGENSIYSAGAAGCEFPCVAPRRVYHIANGTTDTLKAENNWWGASPPTANWFLGLIDRTPWLDSNALGKRVVNHDVASPGTMPSDFELGQNYPNPFNSETVIEYALRRPGHVKIAVFNVLGQLVRVLLDQEIGAGTHRVSWDARNAAGEAVASGVYLYRIEANGFVDSKRMVLVK